MALAPREKNKVHSNTPYYLEIILILKIPLPLKFKSFFSSRGSDSIYRTKIVTVNSSSWLCVYYNGAIVKRWKYYFSRDFDIYYYWRKMRGNFWGNVWCRHFHPPLSVWYVSPYLWMTYMYGSEMYSYNNWNIRCRNHICKYLEWK